MCLGISQSVLCGIITFDISFKGLPSDGKVGKKLQGERENTQILCSKSHNGFSFQLPAPWHRATMTTGISKTMSTWWVKIQKINQSQGCRHHFPWKTFYFGVPRMTELLRLNPNIYIKIGRDVLYRESQKVQIIKEKIDHHFNYVKIKNFYILQHTIKRVKR